jgi:hypothetical protein
VDLAEVAEAGDAARGFARSLEGGHEDGDEEGDDADDDEQLDEREAAAGGGAPRLEFPLDVRALRRG